ncbi:MAG: type III secretion system outer membrane ring subunit SctC, partial [Planctomycetota bacterium]
LAELIDARARERASLEVVTEVFLLQYAWADDQTYFIAGGEVTVPGVATILDQLVNGTDGPVGASTEQALRNRPSLIGQGLIRPRNQAILRAEDAAINAQIAAASADAQARATLAATGGSEGDIDGGTIALVRPVIQPDRRRNAIIVRDLKQRMDEHRKTIQQLDLPHAMVQIEASIIDVDADRGFEFGPPLQAIWQRGGRTLSASARLDTPSGSAPPVGVSASSGNFTLSLSDAGVTEFLANLRALETEGHARVVSKPSILTLDNIDAFLSETEEFFIRVAGFEQADLFNVEVGTTLRIIPHIVYGEPTRQVKLNISLEDGARSTTASVDNIPLVGHSAINTQAILMEGQSLLIGGLMRETTTKIERRVPFIGRLPVVGHLARTHDNETIRLERMVLLTPTIVELPTFSDDGCFEMPELLPDQDDALPEEAWQSLSGQSQDQANRVRLVSHTSAQRGSLSQPVRDDGLIESDQIAPVNVSRHRSRRESP